MKLFKFIDNNSKFGVYNLNILFIVESSSGTRQVKLLPGAAHTLCDISTVIYYLPVSGICNVCIAAEQLDVIVTPRTSWLLRDKNAGTGTGSWHLKIELGDSWQFHSDEISAITFKINASCNSPNCYPAFAFSINNKYFGGIIRFDQVDDNLISPQCNQALYRGNVSELLSNSV